MRTYINGYRSALSSLIKEYKTRNFRDCGYLDEIVYPIIFLSRHIVELYLKALGLRYCVDKNNNVPSSVTASHNLIKIFDDIKGNLSGLCNKASIDFDEEIIVDYLKQINEYDPESYCFRYPINKERVMNFTSWASIDLADFYDKINCLFDYFEMVYMSLDNIVSNDTYDKKYGEYLFKMCCKQQENIKNIIIKLKQEIDRETLKIKESSDSFIDYSNIVYDEDDMAILRSEYTSGISNKDLKFINLLLFVGMVLNNKMIVLSSHSIKDDFSDY